MEKNHPKKSFLFWLALIFILFIIGRTDWLSKPANSILNLSAPIEKTVYQTGSFLSNMFQLNKILKENENLRKQISSLAIDYIKLDTLNSENEYLRKELIFLKEKQYYYVLANVIGRLPSNNQILFINKGSVDGLIEGQAVTAARGIIIGKILKTEANRSWLELLTSPESKLAVGFTSLYGTNGLLIGQVGNNLIVDQIAQGTQINYKDFVITSGLEEKIPRGLIVGKVKQEENIAGQVFKQVKVDSEINYQNLLLVTVIKQ